MQVFFGRHTIPILIAALAPFPTMPCPQCWRGDECVGNPRNKLLIHNENVDDGPEYGLGEILCASCLYTAAQRDATSWFWDGHFHVLGYVKSMIGLAGSQNIF